MAADVVVDASASAKDRGYVAENAVFHAGESAQHASRLLAQRARADSVRPSCGRTGSCRDDAVAESFFATLRKETYYRASFAVKAQAKTAVIEFIKTHCNRKRLHSAIGYRIPAEAMEGFFKRTEPMQYAMRKAA